MNSFLLQSFLEGRKESGSEIIKSAVKYFNICTGATLEMKFTALQSEVDSVLRILVHWQTLRNSSKLIAGDENLSSINA